MPGVVLDGLGELIRQAEMLAVSGDAGSGVFAASSSCWFSVWARFCWSEISPCMMFWSANSTVASALASVEAPRLASSSAATSVSSMGPYWTESAG